MLGLPDGVRAERFAKSVATVADALSIILSFSFATCATTGAAPVPVPPPMPAVMNNMSHPSTSSTIRSRSSIAA